MDSLAYLHLALAYESSITYEFILGEKITACWQCLKSKTLSTQFALRLLSLGIALTILSLAQTAFALLQFGDSGPEVIRLQQNLQRLGYYQGPITGNFREQTEQAVRDFQAAVGISVDGVVGSTTQSRIDSTLTFAGNSPFPPGFPPQSIPSNPAVPFGSPLPGINNARVPYINRILRRGDRGSEVQLLQSRLADLGFYFGEIDGIYGELTERAVLNFQASSRLSLTGIADGETLNALLGNGGSGNANLRLRGYVVVIPTGNDNLVSQVRGIYSTAVQSRNRLGKYVYVGQYANRAEAEGHSAYLRSQGFLNARVVYFR